MNTRQASEAVSANYRASGERPDSSTALYSAQNDVFRKCLKISGPDEDEDDEEEGEFRNAGVIPALMITPAFLVPQNDMHWGDSTNATSRGVSRG